MHPILTKRIEIPWLTKLNDIFSMRLGVLPLAIVTIASSLLCGVAYFSQERVGIELGVWCWFWAALGPIFCLFLSGLLLVAFFRAGRRHGYIFGFGLAFGLAAFAAWCYACIYH